MTSFPRKTTPQDSHSRRSPSARRFPPQNTHRSSTGSVFQKDRRPNYNRYEDSDSESHRDYRDHEPPPSSCFVPPLDEVPRSVPCPLVRIVPPRPCPLAEAAAARSAANACDSWFEASVGGVGGGGGGNVVGVGLALRNPIGASHYFTCFTIAFNQHCRCLGKR